MHIPNHRHSFFFGVFFLCFFLGICSLSFSVPQIQAQEPTQGETQTDSADLLLSDFQPDSVRWYDMNGESAKTQEYIPEGLRVSSAFKENPRVERISIDAKMDLDLTNWNQFQVEVSVTNPKAFSHSSMYLHSKSGWYSCSGPVPAKPGEKITFLKESFHQEEKPQGWDRIDMIRLSFWRIGDEEGQVVFHSLKCVTEPILFVSILNSAGEERWVGKNNAQILSRQLDTIDLNADRLAVPQNAGEAEWSSILAKRQALVVCHTMHLLPETREFLEEWAAKNQKALLFLSEDLREKPISVEDFLLKLTEAPALQKLIENRCVEAAACVLGEPISNSEGKRAEIRRIFAEKGFLAGIEASRKFQARNLKEFGQNLDPNQTLKFKAWWNHNGLGAYPGDWKRTARELKAAGFTAVIPNMLWVSHTLYPSKFAPTNDNFKKYGDQLAQCVEACHAEGIEVHVWRVCFNMRWQTESELYRKYLAEGRIQKNQQGEDLPWLCPSHPANIDLEVNSMLEIAEKYDVDGVHFDYIRYDGRSGCYCERCRKLFEEKIGKKVENWPSDVTRGELQDAYDQWRADQVTHIVKRVHDEMEVKHPNVKISAAVFQSYPSCKNSSGQDWALWANEGWVDFLCPMNYTLNADTFETLCSRQKELVPEGFPLYFGIGEWKLKPEETLMQMKRAVDVKAQGITIFDLSERAAQAVLPPLTKEK